MLPAKSRVLITGESGTGKEVVAEMIHALSSRRAEPLVKVDCAALPHGPIGRELFGFIKGSTVGSDENHGGLLRQADGGTLLLDQVTELPLDIQAMLLQVLDRTVVLPRGDTTYATNCRFLAVTNEHVEDAVKSGKLREGLFYRISTISIDLPPLRERREDIVPLATSFLRRFSADANRNLEGFFPAAANRLRGFEWPGNIHQLMNEVRHAVLVAEGPLVDLKDLSIAPPNSGETETGLSMLEEMERNKIIQILKETGGNKLETAKRLGIGRQTIYNKIRDYGIKP
ncbi:MAG: sigma 54-interacting transcriptional regulator [Verrucomicrobiia bacterium]